MYRTVLFRAKRVKADDPQERFIEGSLVSYLDMHGNRVHSIVSDAGMRNDIQADTPEIPDDTEDVSIDLGFSGNAGYEGQVTTLSMKLKNPSKQYPMENLRLKLVLTDAPYDAGGNLQPGGTVLFPNVNIYVDSEGLIIDGDIVEGTLGTDEDAVIEYSFRLDSLIRNFESLSAFDETLKEYLKDTRHINKVYARIEGNFVLGGVEYDFVSGVREYEVKEKPKLYISYDLKERGNGDYTLVATITNLGSGDANNITLGAPAVPNAGFEMKITGVTSSKGIVERGVSASFDSVKISVLHPGDTAVVTYELAVVSPLTDSQKVSLGKLAALPSIPIKSSTGLGIVMAPMKMEAMRSQSTLEDISSIIDELGYLSNNLHNLTDKTASELGRALADYYDYSVSLQRAISIGECYSMVANLIGLMGSLKDMYDLPEKVKSVAKVFEKKAVDPKEIERLAFLNEWYDGAESKLVDFLLQDVDWATNLIPQDVGYWYDTYNDAVTKAEAMNSKVNMGKTFTEYVRLTKEAAAALAKASEAMNKAMKTVLTEERADQTKIARVNMEEAILMQK